MSWRELRTGKVNIPLPIPELEPEVPVESEEVPVESDPEETDPPSSPAGDPGENQTPKKSRSKKSRSTGGA